MIRVECSRCAETLQLKDAAAGKKVRCPACKAVIAVPDQDDDLLSADDYLDDEDDFAEQARPRARSGRRQSAPKSGSANPAVQALAIGGGVGLLVLGLLYVAIRPGKDTDEPVASNAPGAVANQPLAAPGQSAAATTSAVTPITSSGQPSLVQVGTGSTLLPVSSVALPVFPATPEPFRPSTDPTAKFRTVDCSKVASQVTAPGSRMQLILYLPNQATIPEKSLGCVIVPSAGSNLLSGTGCHDEEYQSETLPYVRAGYAVLGLSLDGQIADREKMTPSDLARAYTEFKAAHAGLVNVRNAIEYVKRYVPEVDHKRIHIAGHSSAGTLALLSAAHFPDLSICVAYAPCCNLQQRMKEAIDNPGLQKLLPGLSEFVEKESPLTHAISIKCPVFLFHAKDDTNTPPSDSADMKYQLKLVTPDTPVERTLVATGGHYEAMIQRGIPSAINWMKAAERLQREMNQSSSADRVISTPNGSTIALGPDPVIQPASTTLRPDAPPGTTIVILDNVRLDKAGDLIAVVKARLAHVPWADSNSAKYHPETRQLTFFAPGKRIILPQADAILTTGGVLSDGISIATAK